MAFSYERGTPVRRVSPTLNLHWCRGAGFGVEVGSASKRGGCDIKRVTDFYMKAQARIWQSGLDCLVCAMFARIISSCPPTLILPAAPNASFSAPPHPSFPAPLRASFPAPPTGADRDDVRGGIRPHLKEYKWFQKVNSPQKLSTCGLLLLIKTIS